MPGLQASIAYKNAGGYSKLFRWSKGLLDQIHLAGMVSLEYSGHSIVEGESALGQLNGVSRGQASKGAPTATRELARQSLSTP